MNDKLHSAPPLSRNALLEKALRLLGRQDYALAELEGRLKPRASTEDDVAWVIGKLREAGFIDDSRVALRRAMSARELRLVGRRRAEQELRQRCLENSAISRGIEAAYRGVEEEELALRYLREKLPTYLRDDKLEDRKVLQRAYGRLRRAGFTHGDSIRALRNHSLLAGSLDEFAADETGD